MSSTFVHNELKRFFPNGLVLDTSGNCFNLFMEFPTMDSRSASVVIYEDGVAIYHKEGEFTTKEKHFQMNEDFFGDMVDDSFRDHEDIIFSSTNDIYTKGQKFFDTNTMIEIGKTWEKFNRCYDIAMKS